MRKHVSTPTLMVGGYKYNSIAVGPYNMCGIEAGSGRLRCTG